MRFRKTFLLMASLAAIAGPTAALASSGDDQYCDPFSGCGTAPSTTTSPKPSQSPGATGGNAGQGSGGQSQWSAADGSNASVPTSTFRTGSSATESAAVARAAEARREAARRKRTAKDAKAVLDAAGLSPVRAAIVAP